MGRAGHSVGAVSAGSMYPKHRADLVQSAVTVERMRSGLIEELHVPSNPLDVLVQQTIAAVAVAVVGLVFTAIGTAADRGAFVGVLVVAFAVSLVAVAVSRRT